MDAWVIALIGFLSGWALSITIFIIVANFRKSPTTEKLLDYWERSEVTAIERNLQLKKIVERLDNISRNGMFK